MSKDKNLIEIAYNNLLAQGKVKNRAEFAKRLGINYISLSRAINNDEHYNTPSLREKIKQVFPTAEFEYQGESSPPRESGDIKNFSIVDDALGAVNKAHGIIEKMQEQMDRLITIIENGSKDK